MDSPKRFAQVNRKVSLINYVTLMYFHLVTSDRSTVPVSCKVTNDYSPVPGSSTATTDQSPVPVSCKVYYACVCDVFNSSLLQRTNEVELVEGYGVYLPAKQIDMIVCNSCSASKVLAAFFPPDANYPVLRDPGEIRKVILHARFRKCMWTEVCIIIPRPHPPIGFVQQKFNSYRTATHYTLQCIDVRACVIIAVRTACLLCESVPCLSSQTLPLRQHKLYLSRASLQERQKTQIKVTVMLYVLISE